MVKKMLDIIRKTSCKKYKWALTISFILTAIVWGMGSVIKNLEFLGLVKYYNTIINFFPDIEERIIKYKPLITVAFLLILLAYFIKAIYKEKVLLIKQHSMSSHISDIVNNIYDEYKVSVFEINQYGQSVAEAISTQDRLLEEALKRDYKYYFYYGIASTPYIFRLGYQFGDERNIRLLHKKRDHEALFAEIKEKDDIYDQLKVVEVFSIVESSDLLVSLGTSFPITPQDKECFNPSTMFQLYFYLQSTNFDNISSYEQMKRYRNQMMDKIREWVKIYNIKTVHIIAATSVAFTFYWAQNFSQNHDAEEIIVYHYEKGTYPWGIKIKAEAEKCYFENTQNHNKNQHIKI